jgi:hypothetical protein
LAVAGAGALATWGACSQSDTVNPPATTGTGQGTTTGGASGGSGSSTTSTSGAGGNGSGAGGSTGTSATTGTGGSSGTTSTTGAGGKATTGSTGGGTGAGGSSGSGGAGGSGGNPNSGGVNVLQFHKNLSRDGLYIDAAFTKTAAAMIHKDTTFNATIQGPTFAQPLYFEGAAGGKNLVIVATLANRVYALDASSGAVVWSQQAGTPAPASNFYCGNMQQIGIVGTPVIDAASKTMFFDAAETSANGPVRKIHRWSLDTGMEQAGWPIDVVTTANKSGTTFDPHVQSQRAAATLVNGTVYFPYGGIIGDCGNYHGWVLGINIANPATTGAFATKALAGGVWGPGGLSSDGTSIFATTGNTTAVADQFVAPAAWSYGEAVLKLAAGPTLGNTAADYFYPSNWAGLDNSDTDIGGTGPVVVNVPGAAPSQLVVAIGKSGVMYLLDSTNLGGLGKGNGTTGEGVFSAQVASRTIITAPVSYTTAQGTYVVFRGNGMGCPAGQTGDLTAVKISATAPPRATVAWCARQGGAGSPIVTTTDGRNEAIVWSLGTGLVGFDGDTGTVIFSGTGANNTISALSQWVTPIAARGRIFVASNSNVYAFTMQ